MLSIQPLAIQSIVSEMWSHVTFVLYLGYSNIFFSWSRRHYLSKCWWAVSNQGFRQHSKKYFARGMVKFMREHFIFFPNCLLLPYVIQAVELNLKSFCSVILELKGIPVLVSLTMCKKTQIITFKCTYLVTFFILLIISAIYIFNLDRTINL